MKRPAGSAGARFTRRRVDGLVANRVQSPRTPCEHAEVKILVLGGTAWLGHAHRGGCDLSRARGDVPRTRHGGAGGSTVGQRRSRQGRCTRRRGWVSAGTPLSTSQGSRDMCDARCETSSRDRPCTVRVERQRVRVARRGGCRRVGRAAAVRFLLIASTVPTTTGLQGRVRGGGARRALGRVVPSSRGAA